MTTFSISSTPTDFPKDVEALHRLVEIAHSHRGQSCIVARFLMSLYNGSRFPFDLSEFRCLDAPVFEDCLTVLRMDYKPRREVHHYFKNGGDVWEKMAKNWNFKDHYCNPWR